MGYNAAEQSVIRGALTDRPNWRIEFRDVVASTQDVCKELARTDAGDHMALIASSQTAGRGTRGRDWSQSLHDDVSLSLVLDPRERYPDLLLPFLSAAATHGCVWGLVDEARIKWPNDVLVGERKIAGILIENHGPLWIAGFGINVNRTDFPPYLADHATSIAAVGEQRVERARVCASLLTNLADLLEAAEQGLHEETLDRYHRGLGLVGHEVAVETENEIVRGRLEDIGPDGVTVASRVIPVGLVAAIREL
ncbi:MAG: biotin--[acetyl-CoA-carboxylase] ligase [Planctomycetota bacterium]|nr:biotin--[acetyl-CoA-carboxylase] ligase [Planctomycetota bacterium]